MTDARNVAAVGALVYANQHLLGVLQAHLDDQEGELLPHLFMADVVRWMVDHWSSQREHCLAILEWWDMNLEHGPDVVQDLIVVSGLENLPDPGLPGAEIREALSERLKLWDPWSRRA